MTDWKVSQTLSELISVVRSNNEKLLKAFEKIGDALNDIEIALGSIENRLEEIRDQNK